MHICFSSFLLTAAASDAKKEALAKKYKLAPMIMNQIADADPTPNGEFCEWMAREASKNQLPMGVQLPTVTDMLTEFIKIKRNPQWTGEKNILNYTAEKFLEAMEQASREDYSKKQKVRDIEENAKKYITEGVKYLGKVEGCYAYQVLTPTASAAMSKGTHWCTQNEGTSTSYLHDGCIYVFTKPEFKNSYGNDKYVQIYISRSRVEAETSEGKDLSSNQKNGLIYTEECLNFIKFLSQFNEIAKTGLEKETIRLKGGGNGLECCSCGDPLDPEGEDEDRAYEVDGDWYCQGCYDEHFTSCEHCGDAINLDDGDYVSGDNGIWCNDCGTYCPACQDGYCTAGRHPVEFHEVVDSRGDDISICDSCFEADYFSCSECDENHPRDEAYDFNGDSVCGDCFKKEWKEDIKDTLAKWAEHEGNDEKIKKDVIDQAELVFKNNKEALSSESFKKMQDEGYLYSWDDLDLITALHFIPEDKRIGQWGELSSAMADPLDYALNAMEEEAWDKDNPSEQWDTDKVMEWLYNDGSEGLAMTDEEGHYIPGVFVYFS